MEVSGGRLRGNTRVLFVLRDSPNMHVSLTQLGIASQGLNSTIVQLNSRGGQSEKSGPVANSPPPLQQGEMKPPPTYDESQFLIAGRRRNMQRRASAWAMNDPSNRDGPRSQSAMSAYSRQPSMSPYNPQSSMSTYRPHTSTSMYSLQSSLSPYNQQAPSIPELMGDESFGQPVRNSTPMITIDEAVSPSSRPILVPDPLPSDLPPHHSPPRSPRNSPPNTTSPPHSPGVDSQPVNLYPRRSLRASSQPGKFSPQRSLRRRSESSASSPPQSPGVLPRPSGLPTPPNSDNLPQQTFQNTGIRTPPSNHSSPGPEVVMPMAPRELSPTPDMGLNSRLTLDTRLTSSPGIYARPGSSHQPPYPGMHSQTYPDVQPQTYPGVYSQTGNIAAPIESGIMSPTTNPYAPSLARRGRGGRHRSQSWLESRCQ